MTTSGTAPRTELRDFVDLDFAQRLEMAENLSPEHVRALQRFAPDATSEVIAGGTAVFGGVNYPSNQIVGMGLYGPVMSGDLDRLESFYRSRGVPSRIVISPLADLSLVELLGHRGYGVAEFNSVLIRRLEGYPQIEPPEGITVERVTKTTAKQWEGVVAQGFAEFGALPENLFESIATLPGSMNFLACVRGTPAGGGMGSIMSDAGIAALYGSATIPAFRGQGVQAALIERRLWEAAQAGCEYAVVSTLPGRGSQRNMERRGFRVAYTKLVMVRLWPETESQGTDDGY